MCSFLELVKKVHSWLDLSRVTGVIKLSISILLFGLVNVIPVLSQAIAAETKVSVCHKEAKNGEPASYHLIEISSSALWAHRKHGDSLPGHNVPGDPSKKFDSQCLQIDSPIFSVFAAGEATFKTVNLSCSTVGEVIYAIDATYGANCIGGGYSPDPNYPGYAGQGTPTVDLKAVCDGRADCLYTINHTVIGDYYFLCLKEYSARFYCVSND